jgi:hypothetical protein
MTKTANSSWFCRFCQVAALPLLFSSTLVAAVRSHTSDLIVERPSQLPVQARIPGEACFLYWSGAGATYLYVEQEQGTRLAVFDVTDPDRITLASSTTLAAPGAFDFVRPLDGQSELVRFRDSQRFAVLDLSKAKSPSIGMVGAALASSAESLSPSVILVANESPSGGRALPRDYQVVDMAAGSGGAVVATVKQVTQKVKNSYTGTTFLLGSEGLSVIRRPSVENEYRQSMRQ